MYEIRHADGREEQHDTYEQAIASLEAQYPDCEIGHDGDLTEGGDKTLCWANEEDAEGDNSVNSVAAIYEA